MPLTKRQKVAGGFGIAALITAIIAAIKPPKRPEWCTPGEPDRCFNGDLYRCSMEGKWELLEKDSPVCVGPTRLHGRVRDKANHNLLSGVLVELVDTGLFDTTVSGMYHIDDTPFGTQTLKFTHPDYKPLVKTVDLVPGINNKIEDVFLETIAVIGSITGRLEELDVVTGFTTPIPNIAVNIDGYTTTCDSEGYFYFADMPFAHYSTLTAEGYKPLPIDLDVIGDMDLGVVEMVRIEVEFVILLDRLVISPESVVIGVPVGISCRASLSIAPVGEEVTRTVILYINGAVAEIRDISLVRTNKYWPATTTVRFEYAPAISGTYNVEVDGLTGSFEVAPEYINYVTPIPIKQIYDIKPIAQYQLDRATGVWQCPVCGEMIPIGCRPEEGKPGRYEYNTDLVKDHFVGDWYDYSPPGVYGVYYRDAAHYEWKRDVGVGWWGVFRDGGGPETILPICLDSDDLSVLGDILEFDISLLEVSDIGFDGNVAWYTVRVSHNEPDIIAGDPHGWRISLTFVKEGDYSKFLAWRNDPNRRFPGGGTWYDYRYGPKIEYPTEKPWSWIAPSLWIDHADIGHPENTEPSDVISHSGEAPIPSGHYRIVLEAWHTTLTSYNESYGVKDCKGWEIGEIIFP